MRKLISVLIPAYNASSTIERCLQSIVNQSFQDFEIVVSDDGSKDDTGDKVRQFSSEHPHVSIVLISHHNTGVSHARKRALKAASGEWVTFVDSDDLLTENALADMVAAASDRTDLVVGFLYPPSRKIEEMPKPEIWQTATMDGRIPSSPCAKLYRRKILSPSMLDIPREITSGEDLLMNIAYVFAMSKPPRFIYTTLYNYTRQPLSLSHTTKGGLEYEYAFDKLRLQAIPEQSRAGVFHALTRSRLNGVIGCAYDEAAVIAKKEHPYLQLIRDSVQEWNYKPSVTEQIILNSKSAVLIKLTAFARMLKMSLTYRLHSIF
ncbi:MAG: glycosyltransferase family 2 protein [Muribaculaceae bacterium]|nr:glycosyltransferase family 2 protein [Muribaculaceae bacterium]